VQAQNTRPQNTNSQKLSSIVIWHSQSESEFAFENFRVGEAQVQGHEMFFVKILKILKIQLATK